MAPKPFVARKPVIVTCVALSLLMAACGSSTGSKSGGTTTIGRLPTSTKLGVGVTASTVKVGIALLDYSKVRQFTDTIRTTAEQKRIYQIYIDYVNHHGGIAGRTIVPDFKFYSPISPAAILDDCTAWAQDDKVFAVIGTFFDLSGDAQTCIAKQQKRVLLTFNLTQAMLDRSPPGLIVTPGWLPERIAGVLVSLLEKQHLLAGKKVAVMDDRAEASVAQKYVVPALKKANVPTGALAILNVDTAGDTSAAQQQLDSFIERWKTQHVNAVYLSGDAVSSKQFVQKLRTELPNVMLITDTGDVLSQAQQFQEAKVKPNPYEGIFTAQGPTPHEYDNSANWKYCRTIYEAATHQPAPDGEHTIKTSDGKIDDTYGVINDACQVLSMFHDIAARVGKYLNNDNWINTVNTFGAIANRGSGPYSSFHAGKYSADDNFRLEAYDPTIGATGNWRPVTPLEDIPG